MVEFREQQPIALLPEVQDMILETEEMTGLPVEIRPDPRVAKIGRALYAISAGIDERHLLLYDPKYEEYLSHLVGHELGHVRHYHEAPPEDKLIPVITMANRDSATDQLMPEVEEISKWGFSNHNLTDRMEAWMRGIVTQMAYTPPDIGIERWLHSAHPPLHDIQRRSLASITRTLQQVLSPWVERNAPPSIWVANNAMNYTLIKDAAEFLEEPWMLHPYRGTVAESVGEDLVSIASAIKGEEGLERYQDITDAWAERLGMGDWYTWKSLPPSQPTQ